MKRFFINLLGSIIIVIVFIYDMIFNKDIRKINNPDPMNVYDPEDL